MSSASDRPHLLERQALLRRLRALEQRKAAQESRDDPRLAMPADEILEMVNQKYLAMGIADPDQ